MHSYAQVSCDLVLRFYILRLKETVVFKYYVTYRKVIVICISNLERVLLVSVFRRVRKITKNRRLASSYLSVFPHGMTRLPLDRFS